MKHLRLKVLPLPGSIAGLIRLFDGDITDEELFGKDCVQIPAVVGRAGWYFDRMSRLSWYELVDGRAFLADAKQFLYELGTSRRDERPLTQQERDAIRTLLDYGNAGNLRELSYRLYEDDNRKHLREVVVGARIIRKQWEKT